MPRCWRSSPRDAYSPSGTPCARPSEGRFDNEHALVVGAILAHIDFLDEAIDRFSDLIEEQIAPFARPLSRS